MTKLKLEGVEIEIWCLIKYYVNICTEGRILVLKIKNLITAYLDVLFKLDFHIWLYVQPKYSHKIKERNLRNVLDYDKETRIDFLAVITFLRNKYIFPCPSTFFDHYNAK